MKIKEILSEKWSAEYKRSIDCNNPKGFSQKAHCAGRKKNEGVTEGSLSEFAGKPGGGSDRDEYEDLLFNLAYQYWRGDSEGWGAERKLNLLGWKADYGDDVVAVTLDKIGGGDSRQYDIEEFENFGGEQGVAESTLNEYRNALYDFVKSKFPTWPEYVLKDFLYAQAKGIRDKEELKDWLERNQKDYGQVKWRLEKLPITLDIFTPKTQRMIKQREGGSSNPFQVPKDAERHAQQLKMIQQQGVRTEPIIVAKLDNGYDLIEGWHRTIQHLQQYPEGYTGPAWVAYGATYTSESKQGVAEGVDIGKEWMSDTELDQYVPDHLQQQWRELLGYDQDGNPSALWANITGGYEPDVRDPEHRALMVKVANKWFAAKKIPNVKFFNVRDADDELDWLVQIGQQGVAENFADGKVKGKSRPGRVKKAGASCNGSVTDLRKRAKNASGEKAKMYHWCANMKSGRNK